MLESTNPLVLLLVAPHVLEEFGVVVRSNRAAFPASRSPIAADHKPQQGAHEWHHKNDDHPEHFGKRSHTSLVDEQEIDDREDIKNDRRYTENQQSTHELILRSRTALGLTAYTGKVKPWVAYSLIRVGIFAAAFAVLRIVGLDWWLAAILAAIIGLCIAYIFFRKLRDAVALDIANRRAVASVDSDALAEDEG